MKKHKIQKAIEDLKNRMASDYSRREYEKYKKRYPHTKKQPTDPMFAIKKKPNSLSQTRIINQPKKQLPHQTVQQTVQPHQVQQPAQPHQVQQPAQPAQPQQIQTPQVEPNFDEIKQVVKKGNLRDSYKRKKDAIHQHLKKEIQEFTTAGEAIKKFVKKENLTDHEKEAVQEASRKIAAMFVSMTLGGHVGVTDLAEHFAIEQVVESASAQVDHSNQHPIEHKTDQHSTDTSHTPLTENTITKINFKGLGAKMKDIFSKRKDAITYHLKNKANNFRNAGSAISKFVSGKNLTDEEKNSLKDAAKDVASALLFSVVGGHLALASIVQNLAISTIAQAVVSKAPVKASILKKIGVLMKRASGDEQDIFIEMVISQVIKQLENIEGYTPQQLKELARQIQKNVERDPKMRKELEKQFGKK